jgi:two-component system sensor histidine kinase KdpD
MSRGRLRIYLGAAPGVGKTFAMLGEGRRRRDRGTDVVVGYVETHGRPRTAEQLEGLEVLPRTVLTYRGARFEEMDTAAVLARRPAVVLVDELAHTNVPGSAHDKRYEDVQEILEAGIDVITTVNIQHLESVNDVVEQITGVKQHETLPDAVVRAADQVELVDMTPEALRRRMAHGNVYAAEKVDAALSNYFRVGNLSALRELALLWLADKVEDALQAYMQAHGISAPWETRERVVVAITGAPSGEHLIRRAARMARRSQGDLVGVHIASSDGLASGGPSARLEEHRRLLVDLGGEYHEAIGSEVAGTLVQFARAERATQLVLGASRRSRWTELLRGSVIGAVLREAGDIDVHVISEPEPEPGVQAARSASLGPRRRRRPDLPVRRQLLGWLVAVVGLVGLTLLLHLFAGNLNLTSDTLLYLLLVTVVAVIGGRWPALASAVVASLLVNWFFTDPVHTFTIAEPQNLLALLIFLAVAALVSTEVSALARRSADVERARAEAEALARVAGTLVAAAEPLAAMVGHLRSTFDLDAVAVVVRGVDGEWLVEVSAGHPVPVDPTKHPSVPLVEGAHLVYDGPPLGADDRRVLTVFAAQVAAALERSRLEAEAAEARTRRQADELRTAILRAVSHDLRTPLASIKASVTSLQQHDVAWTAEAEGEFLATIDEETDRLDRLVGNLLDMSRIETGSLDVLLRPVGLDEVVPQALDGLPDRGDRVEVRVPDTLPNVLADQALLERAVANLAANALRHSPPDQPVRIEAAEVGGHVDLRIVDRGPGVPVSDRDRIFEPFQRLGDAGNGAGVGLGMAVARGFVAAMEGDLELEDTPGGGLTAVISLEPVEP